MSQVVHQKSLDQTASDNVRYKKYINDGECWSKFLNWLFTSKVFVTYINLLTTEAVTIQVEGEGAMGLPILAAYSEILCEFVVLTVLHKELYLLILNFCI